MSIVGISETKWFDDVYKVVSFTVLQSGRCVPQFSDTIQCGEGVAIVLDLLMATSGETCLPLAPGLCMLIRSCV